MAVMVAAAEYQRFAPWDSSLLEGSKSDIPKVGPKRSSPPRYMGLDSAARGFADHLCREGDSLLIWYRTQGLSCSHDVELYLARRAIACKWKCTEQQAVVVIRSAMEHVATRVGRTPATDAKMQKARFHHLRATASSWLRAGIMEAVYRYEKAAGHSMEDR